VRDLVHASSEIKSGSAILHRLLQVTELAVREINAAERRSSLGQQALAHGTPGHKCYVVFPWNSEYWLSNGLHHGAHDCPDGGCR